MPLDCNYKVHGRIGTSGFNDAPAIYWDGGNVEPRGSTNMSRITIFSYYRKTNVTEYIFNTIRFGATGWAQATLSSVSYYFVIVDSGPVTRTCNLIPTVIPENILIVLIGSYDETELICYANGESATSGPYVGFTAGTEDLTIGAYSDTKAFPGVNTNIIACLATDTYALSLAEMATAEAFIIDELEQGRYIDTTGLPGIGWNWYWDARDCHASAPGTWYDRNSNVLLNETGNTEKFHVPARFPP